MRRALVTVTGLLVCVAAVAKAESPVYEEVWTGGPDVPTTPFEPAPCSWGQECEGSVCVSTLGGGVCTTYCVDSCANGWVCRSVAYGEMELVYVCLPPGLGGKLLPEAPPELADASTDAGAVDEGELGPAVPDVGESDVGEPDVVGDSSSGDDGSGDDGADADSSSGGSPVTPGDAVDGSLSDAGVTGDAVAPTSPSSAASSGGCSAATGAAVPAQTSVWAIVIIGLVAGWAARNVRRREKGGTWIDGTCQIPLD
jgi:MYXO-CTERM domain-containing protein